MHRFPDSGPIARVLASDVAAVALILGRLGGACATAFVPATLTAALTRVAEDLQLPQKAVLKAARLALTGGSTGPGVAALMTVLGRERSLARLVHFLAQPSTLLRADEPVAANPKAQD
jgi:glutamyl/glutaminyl-tRNA synthetase